jgi:hypothetical protein
MNICELTLDVSHPHKRRTCGLRGATQWEVRLDVGGVSESTLGRQRWTLVRFIFIFCFIILPLCNKYSDDIITFIFIHSVIICVVLFDVYMRYTRNCPLNTGVTRKHPHVSISVLDLPPTVQMGQYIRAATTLCMVMCIIACLSLTSLLEKQLESALYHCLVYTLTSRQGKVPQPHQNKALFVATRELKIKQPTRTAEKYPQVLPSIIRGCWVSAESEAKREGG